MYTIEVKLFYILIAATLFVGGVVCYFLFGMVRQFRHYRRGQENSDRARIEALEEERKLIAADLHDDIGPILSATLFKLSELEPVTERQKEMLQQSREHIDSIFLRIRSIASLLAPQAIERKGALAALEEFNELYGRKHNLDVQFDGGNCKELSPERSLHLFRMLQEILHNAIRHSKARQLIIRTETSNSKLVVYTADDGVGFDVSKVSERPGLGLKNLAIRARMIGASLRTESLAGQGTKYRIELALEKNQLN